MDGTIIFYNLDNGAGLILSQSKEKYKFDIEMWDDFEHMPSIGLKISFEVEDEIVKKIVKYKEPIILEEIDEDSVNAPTSIEDAARMIIDTDMFGASEEDSMHMKLDADSYSVKTVPTGYKIFIYGL